MVKCAATYDDRDFERKISARDSQAGKLTAQWWSGDRQKRTARQDETRSCTRRQTGPAAERLASASIRKAHFLSEEPECEKWRHASTNLPAPGSGCGRRLRTLWASRHKQDLFLGHAQVQVTVEEQIGRGPSRTRPAGRRRSEAVTHLLWVGRHRLFPSSQRGLKRGVMCMLDIVDNEELTIHVPVKSTLLWLCDEWKPGHDYISVPTYLPFVLPKQKPKRHDYIDWNIYQNEQNVKILTWLIHQDIKPHDISAQKQIMSSILQYKKQKPSFLYIFKCWFWIKTFIFFTKIYSIVYETCFCGGL